MVEKPFNHVVDPFVKALKEEEWYKIVHDIVAKGLDIIADMDQTNEVVQNMTSNSLLQDESNDGTLGVDDNSIGKPIISVIKGHPRVKRLQGIVKCKGADKLVMMQEIAHSINRNAISMKMSVTCKMQRC
ncbi:hypothetical protein AMTR_s00122p00125810 [Amborella trichopoda]|uniref:Uncharacterized protein n=1 Tax=Amborella trichopoda TaxID=13333 RepID=W1NQJ0_AMBTC|nr:hypothetical protein AMTR_s00122p00125810 [Amborella trichopoda]